MIQDDDGRRRTAAAILAQAAAVAPLAGAHRLRMAADSSMASAMVINTELYSLAAGVTFGLTQGQASKSCIGSAVFALVKACWAGADGAHSAPKGSLLEHVGLAHSIQRQVSAACGRPLHNPGIAAATLRGVVLADIAARAQRAARMRNLVCHEPFLDKVPPCDRGLAADVARALVDASTAGSIGRLPATGVEDGSSPQLQPTGSGEGDDTSAATSIAQGGWHADSGHRTSGRMGPRTSVNRPAANCIGKTHTLATTEQVSRSVQTDPAACSLDARSQVRGGEQLAKAAQRLGDIQDRLDAATHTLQDLAKQHDLAAMEVARTLHDAVAARADLVAGPFGGHTIHQLEERKDVLLEMCTASPQVLPYIVDINKQLQLAEASKACDMALHEVEVLCALRGQGRTEQLVITGELEKERDLAAIALLELLAAGPSRLPTSADSVTGGDQDLLAIMDGQPLLLPSGDVPTRHTDPAEGVA